MVRVLSLAVCTRTTAIQVQKYLPRFKYFSNRIANISYQISSQIMIF